MTQRKIGGRIFTTQGEDLLSVRRSWLPYLGGCVLALASFVAGLLWIVSSDADTTIYEGGSRARAGRPITWEQQSTGQHLQVIAVIVVPGGALMLLSIAYVIFGSEDQRKPFEFDRAAGVIRRGDKQLCKMSDVVCVRVVHAPGGSTKTYRSSLSIGIGGSGMSRNGPGRLAARTGIFLKLPSAPWSIELDWFSREATAKEFAAVIAQFLRVQVVEDPILLQQSDAKSRARGFPVIPPPGSKE